LREADRLNEKLLEQYIITNNSSDIENSNDDDNGYEDVNNGLLRSESSASSSDKGKNDTIRIFYNKFVCLAIK